MAALGLAPTAASAAPRTHPVVSAPATARVGQDFAVTVRLDRARDVGAFQVDALVGENAAQVVTAIPSVAGGRILDAANASGSARVGFFNARGALGADNSVAEILVTPQHAGRLQVRLSAPLVVDRN